MKRTHAVTHCALTPGGVYFDKEDILKWHLEENGWKRPGYYCIILLDGTEQYLVGDNGDDTVDPAELTNGALGWNSRAVHYCLIGGTDRKGRMQNTFSDTQIAKWAELMKKRISSEPDIKLIGHNQISTYKFCPSFHVPTLAERLGIPKHNIDYKQYVENPHIPELIKIT